MNALRQRCEGRWFDLLQMFGIDRRHLNGRHGPCPMCQGKDRFRFDNKAGNGTWICNQCGAGDGVGLLLKFKHWDFKHCAFELDRVVGKAQVRMSRVTRSPERQQTEMARLWSEGRPVDQGDPVALYLAHRGLDLPRYPESIRCVERCWHAIEKANHPAMVARVDAPDGHMTQIHKTFLSNTGRKADVDPVRMFHWGGFEDGAAVRIGKPACVMGVAEGLETSMSAAILHKMPVWATLSAQALLKWNPPDDVEEIYVFGDRDDNFTGQSKAYALANRLSIQRPDRHVVVSIPAQGNDWNDGLRG